MSARVEQAKWAVILLTRENPPGDLRLDDERRIDLEMLDLDLALGAFSRAVSRGDVDQRFTAVEALAWLYDRRAISPLQRALRDPAWHVRHAAACGLNWFRPLPDWAPAPPCAAITDVEPAVRVEVARALRLASASLRIARILTGEQLLRDPLGRRRRRLHGFISHRRSANARMTSCRVSFARQSSGIPLSP